MKNRWRIIIRFLKNSLTQKNCELRCVTIETRAIHKERAEQVGHALAGEIGWSEYEMEVMEA